MQADVPEIKRYRVERLGETIVIQWLSVAGEPMQTIALSIPQARQLMGNLVDMFAPTGGGV